MAEGESIFAGKGKNGRKGENILLEKDLDAGDHVC